MKCRGEGNLAMDQHPIGGGGGKYYYSSSLLAMNNVVSQAAWATRLGYRLRFTKFGTRNK